MVNNLLVNGLIPYNGDAKMSVDVSVLERPVHIPIAAITPCGSGAPGFLDRVVKQTVSSSAIRHEELANGEGACGFSLQVATLC